MNTMPDPFVPTHPPLTPSPPAPTPTTGRPKRRSGGKKKPASGRTRKPAAVAAPVEAPAPTPRKLRKPRVVKETAPKARKLDIGAIVSATAGLKSDDARLLVKIYTMLSDHSAKSRAAITASLGKLFA